jgi:hypothetical protein
LSPLRRNRLSSAQPSPDVRRRRLELKAQRLALIVEGRPHRGLGVDRGYLGQRTQDVIAELAYLAVVGTGVAGCSCGHHLAVAVVGARGADGGEQGEDLPGQRAHWTRPGGDRRVPAVEVRQEATPAAWSSRSCSHLVHRWVAWIVETATRVQPPLWRRASPAATRQEMMMHSSQLAGDAR